MGGGTTSRLLNSCVCRASSSGLFSFGALLRASIHSIGIFFCKLKVAIQFKYDNGFSCKIIFCENVVTWNQLVKQTYET